MPRKPVIHVVMACMHYEGDRPVHAFADPEAAEALKKRIDAHTATRPEPPSEILETPENDAEFDRWWKAHQRWCNRHPAGQSNALRDFFTVIKVPFTP